MQLAGYKGKEVAAALGISTSWVSNLVARAREIVEDYKNNQ